WSTVEEYVKTMHSHNELNNISYTIFYIVKNYFAYFIIALQVFFSVCLSFFARKIKPFSFYNHLIISLYYASINILVLCFSLLFGYLIGLLTPDTLFINEKGFKQSLLFLISFLLFNFIVERILK